MTGIRTAFLGLGAMGWHMAAHQAQAAKSGSGTCMVWNRTPSKAQAHAQQFGSVAVALPEALQADLIISCLPTSQEVSELIEQTSASLGSLDTPQSAHGRYWVDCTSGHPERAPAQRALLLERGLRFLDAPVSGGTAGAEAGTLTVMVGGDAQEVQMIRPLLAFADKVIHVGPIGSGFAVKAINNALLAAQLWATGEGLAILGRAGVDVMAALEVINASSGRSNASQNLIPQRVLTRTFPVTFQLGLLAKDTRIALDVAQSTHSSAPLLAQTSALIQAAAQHLGPEVDHSACLQLIELMNQQEIK